MIFGKNSSKKINSIIIISKEGIGIDDFGLRTRAEGEQSEAN